jgi:subfamily B ATP-binding cassette protein MsbA
MRRKKKVKKTNKNSGMRIYKRLLTYIYPHWKLFVISIFGYLIYAATQPMFAAVIKHIIDTLQAEDRAGVEYLPLFFVGLIFVRGIGGFLGNYFLARVSCNVVHALRCSIFDHYTHLPSAYFDKNNSGHMMSRITHNVGEVTQATTDSARTFVREGFTATGLFGYLMYMNWQLSLVFLAITPIIAILVSYVSKRLRRLSKNIQESIGDMTQITSEMVGGQRIVRSFGGEAYERERFHDKSWFNRGQTLKQASTVAIHSPLIQLIIALALGVLMHLALKIMEGATAGEFVAYLTTAFLLPRPIRLLTDANSGMQKGIAAAESLFQVLDTKVEVDEGEIELSDCQGKIEFRNVSFSYEGLDDLVLNNISFTVEPGQTVALVGASGSGKSTIRSLIPRFFEHGVGEIFIDGVNID